MKNILLIDDDNGLLDIYERLINKRYDYAHLSRAANGKEALEKTLQTDYTVIISDIEMPVMDGIEFHKRLKEKNHNMARRVIFISGNPYHPGFSYIFEEKCPYLCKPFVKEEFYKPIDSILGSELA